jgi:hypothetical protein
MAATGQQIVELARTIASQATAIAEGTLTGSLYGAACLIMSNAETLKAWVPDDRAIVTTPEPNIPDWNAIFAEVVAFQDEFMPLHDNERGMADEIYEAWEKAGKPAGVRDFGVRDFARGFLMDRMEQAEAAADGI